MNNKYLFAVFSFFINYLCNAQDIYFKHKPLFFFDEQTQQIILIENDALVYKTNEKVKIPLKHSEYPANLNEYIPFSIKKKNYFVHEGCGVVLEYRNDSIVRLDNSFLHKNQFDAASFVYKNEIYFFGGYGLFTHKNILTKYDFNMREWVLSKYYSNLNSPSLASPINFSINENIFLFGGYDFNDKNQLESFNEKFVWILNAKTKEWKRYISKVINDCEGVDNFLVKINLQDGIYIQHCKKTYFIDFKNNLCKEYKSDFILNVLNSKQIKNKVYLLIAAKNNKLGEFRFTVSDVNDILKNPISEAPFYYEERPYYLYGIAAIFILLMLWFLYKKRRFISYYLSPTVPFQYWQETELLYFKGKKVKHLSEDDIKILNKMALHPNQFISLNEFNEMFTIDYENENYSAIVKRREKKLETFLQMIANVSSYDFQDLLHERKNEVDKRIKEVLFLPKKIKFVKK
jgi:hypothetical protein